MELRNRTTGKIQVGPIIAALGGTLPSGRSPNPFEGRRGTRLDQLRVGVRIPFPKNFACPILHGFRNRELREDTVAAGSEIH